MISVLADINVSVESQDIDRFGKPDKDKSQKKFMRFVNRKNS